MRSRGGRVCRGQGWTRGREGGEEWEDKVQVEAAGEGGGGKLSTVGGQAVGEFGEHRGRWMAKTDGGVKQANTKGGYSRDGRAGARL